jgi:sialate O-acetylesterase
MVLQRDMSVPVWGWAEASDRVTIAFGGQSKTATAGEDGKWLVRLDPMPACAEPRTLTVENRTSAIGKLQVSDVLVGEVWLCSGQSNMEIPVQRATAAAEVLAAAEDDLLRWFRVTPATAEAPASDVRGQWTASSPSTVADFSAVAWHFAHRLRQQLGAPVGLLHAACGGTIAEAWIDQAALRTEPALRELMNDFDRDVADPSAARAAFVAAQTRWESATAPRDPGNEGVKQGWAAPETDVHDWPLMTLPCFWQKAGELYSGVFWFRRTVEIPTTWAGRTLRLQIGACDKGDVTYFNGVEVGSIRIEDRPDAWALPRDYRIAPGLVKAGCAVIAVRVLSHMHAGGMTGPAADMRLSLADEPANGAIPLAGEWAWRVEHNFGYAHLPVLPREPMWPLKASTPGALYNAMIAPLIPYAIQGAIWYQGESNADHQHPEWYRSLFPLLIRDWRRQWGRDFAFYFVQLANFKGVCEMPAESRWAEVREAQRLTLSEPHTGMAAAVDIGEGGDIHPSNKRDVGHRLSALALAKTYGMAEIVPSGPLVREARGEGGSVRITFDHADGLVCRGSHLSEFALAGENRVFVWADAVIEGETVLVSNPAVQRPVVVRYAWADNPKCSLYNAAGLPAAPFQMNVEYDTGKGAVMKKQARVMMSALAACGLMMGVARGAEDKEMALPEMLKDVSRFAFFGDSLTDGSDFPDYVVNTLNKTYPGHNFSYINAGVCGNKSYDLVDRLDRDVLSQKPDLTFILIGTNDSGGNPLAQFKAELSYLCRRLKMAGSKVALITLTGSTDPKMMERFNPYEDTIVEVARLESVMLVDALSLFQKWQSEGKEMYYSKGDAHHSIEGFRGMARAILSALGVPETVEMELTITPPPNVLTKWEESGAITNKSPDPSMVKEWTPYDYTKWIDSKDWSWKPLAQRGAWFALQGDAKGRTAFARTTYDAAKEGLYELQVGGGVPLAVWINGVKVYTLAKTNGYHPNANRTPVLLKKGKNEITIMTGFYAYVGMKALE